MNTNSGKVSIFIKNDEILPPLKLDLSYDESFGLKFVVLFQRSNSKPHFCSRHGTMVLRLHNHGGIKQLKQTKNHTTGCSCGNPKLQKSVKALYVFIFVAWTLWILNPEHGSGLDNTTAVLLNSKNDNTLVMPTETPEEKEKVITASNIKHEAASVTTASLQRQQPTTAENYYNASRLCKQNPYNAKLVDSLDEVAYRVDDFTTAINQHYMKAKHPQMKREHRRFFPFYPRAPCSAIDCVGGECRKDTSKIMCAADQLKEGCIIYSIGGNDWWEFELDLLEKTPCHIHTFDCTGPIERFHKPVNDRLHFHHVCLGTSFEPASSESNPTCVAGYVEKNPGKCGETWTLLEMQQRLQHSRIDLLKMDIEGFEWSMFDSWPELDDQKRSEELLLPMQLLVEVRMPKRNCC